MTEQNFQNIDLQRMEVQANMLSTFETASQVMTRLYDTAMLIDFSHTESLQQFYDSLYYFVDGCEALKEGFKVLCSSYDIELADPNN